MRFIILWVFFILLLSEIVASANAVRELRVTCPEIGVDTTIRETQRRANEIADSLRRTRSKTCEVR